VALGNQPLVQLTGTLPVRTGMADEDPGQPPLPTRVAAPYRPGFDSCQVAQQQVTGMAGARR
jgi:hypothetical protein